ncbi:MAG: D-alanine--D-alanine ligase [Holosporales bacterium]|jgi:D-alanine-D-alanine ligase|nr:D-alanine--D-alanine ligase [Holosporales bacterium]
MKIAVLLGGWSPEREVSLDSGRCVADGLRQLGHEVFEIDVKKDLRSLTDDLYGCSPDVIFNVLHGIGGEDGVIQGVLELFGVPYSSSGVLGSAIAFDKAICKELAKAKGIKVADGFEITKEEIASIDMEYPFVVKPANNGSSIGVFLIFNDSDFHRLKEIEWNFGDKILVEKYIGGREFTVMVLDGKAVGIVEITCKREFYDYSSKYEIGGSTHLSNFELDESTVNEMFDMSEKVFKACCCRGIARADFRYDGEKVYFLELNTQPGLTTLSLVPDIARFKGTSFEELLEKVIEVTSGSR